MLSKSDAAWVWNRSHLATVVLTAAAVRTGFLLWALSGAYFVPQNTLSHVYFQRGYALAHGYGYVFGASEKGEALLRELHHRINLGETGFRIPAGALAESDVAPDIAHPPGTALLIAAFHRLLGAQADLPLQLSGVLLDSAAAGIFAWVVTAFFGLRLGVIAGLLYAVFPPLAYYAVAKEPDGLLGFFISGALACCIQAARAESWRAGALWHALAGTLIGLSGYLRPDFILLPVLLGLGLWAWRQRFWVAVRSAALVQAIALLVLLPWAIRNHAICGRWIFTSTMVGAVLITGLGEFHNPWSFGALDEDRIAQAKSQGLASAWQCEGDLYFRDLFFRSVAEQPYGYAMAILKRIPLVIATPYGFGFDNPLKTTTFTTALEQGEDRYHVLLRRPQYVIAAYGDYLLMSAVAFVCLVATVWMGLREKHRLGILLLLASPHLYSIGTHLLTHMEPRFLLPTMFPLLLGPAYLILQAQRSPGPAAAIQRVADGIAPSDSRPVASLSENQPPAPLV